MSDACKLCGMRQTLPHILNKCRVSLHLRHYNIRHDAVLEVIESGIKPLLSDGDCSLADLHDHQPYTFPPHITHTDLRPDLVLWNNNSHLVCLVELTICYETRFEEAHNLKEGKCADLVEEIREAGEYSPELITLEVGSRGPFHQVGFDDLKSCHDAPTKEWEAMLMRICKVLFVNPTKSGHCETGQTKNPSHLLFSSDKHVTIVVSLSILSATTRYPYCAML